MSRTRSGLRRTSVGFLTALPLLTIAGLTPVPAATPPFYPDTTAFDSVEAVRRQVETSMALGMPVVDTIWLADTVPMEMRLVPAGRFRGGSPTTESGHEADETLRIDTMPQPFYLSTTVLTQRQYMAIKGALPPKAQTDSAHMWASGVYGGFGHYDPFYGTYRPDCAARIDYWPMRDSLFPAIQTFAVPGWRFACVTEKQMEYATRAGTLTMYYTGNDEAGLARSAWYDKNSGGAEHPVGQKAPNAWGFRDMLGNVWQWITGFTNPAFGYDTNRDANNIHAVKSGNYDTYAGGNGIRSANVYVQQVPSGVRVAMNCASNLMAPTRVNSKPVRSSLRPDGISVSGDRIAIARDEGNTGAISITALDGKAISCGLGQGPQVIRYKDLHLSPGSYLLNQRRPNGCIMSIRFIVQ
jgi:formylglycine-generating enzyme required for sulfatase activity